MSGEKLKCQGGFTLLEVLIATTLSIVVIAGIYSLYRNQLKIRVVQDSILEMRQNLRAAMYLMGRDIRMAGYSGSNVWADHEVSISSASDSEFSFSYYSDDTLTTIGYELYDEDEDGISEEIGRTVDGEAGLVAEGIENIQFMYILDDDTETTAPSDIQLIRAVRLTLLAKASRSDTNYTNISSYSCPEDSNGSITVWGPFKDSYHRKLLTGTFLLRNMGI